MKRWIWLRKKLNEQGSDCVVWFLRSRKVDVVWPRTCRQLEWLTGPMLSNRLARKAPFFFSKNKLAYFTTFRPCFGFDIYAQHLPKATTLFWWACGKCHFIENSKRTRSMETLRGSFSNERKSALLSKYQQCKVKDAFNLSDPLISIFRWLVASSNAD